jgi:adenylate cyclase
MVNGGAPDFEAEGLLGDLTGEARAARLRLLRRLFDAGIGLDVLREAVADDRLVILPAEHALSGEPRYTTRELSEQAGVPVGYFEAVRRAAGLAEVDPDERNYDDQDLEAARIIAGFYDAGYDRDGILEVCRVLGRGLAQAADAMGEVFGQSFIKAGVTEEELGLRNAQAAGEMIPRAAPLLEYLLKRHVRERLRHQAVSQAMLEAGQMAGAREVAVSFADMVGFTQLGERMPVEEVGGLAGRLGELASECVSPPVRLVKTIGDAAMLASLEAGPLLEATLDLVAAAEGAERFPRLRAGAAFGPALPRSGDWYGRPVNIASRITDLAEPGTVVGTRELCDAAEDVCTWESVGARVVKGVDGEIELFRADRRD